MKSWRVVKDALGAVPVSESKYNLSYPIMLQLPQHFDVQEVLGARGAAERRRDGEGI